MSNDPNSRSSPVVGTLDPFSGGAVGVGESTMLEAPQIYDATEVKATIPAQTQNVSDWNDITVSQDNHGEIVEGVLIDSSAMEGQHSARHRIGSDEAMEMSGTDMNITKESLMQAFSKLRENLQWAALSRRDVSDLEDMWSKVRRDLYDAEDRGRSQEAD
jgi:hypothetical protein